MTAFDPMAAADNLAKLVSLFAGFKAQLVDAGFSEESAELMTVELARKTLRGAG